MLRVTYIGEDGPSIPLVLYADGPMRRVERTAARSPTTLRCTYDWEKLRRGDAFVVPYWPTRSAEYAQRRVAKAFCHWRARDRTSRHPICVKTRQMGEGVFVERTA